MGHDWKHFFFSGRETILQVTGENRERGRTDQRVIKRLSPLSKIIVCDLLGIKSKESLAHIGANRKQQDGEKEFHS